MEKVRAVFKAGEKESFRRNKKEALSEKKQTLLVQQKNLQEVLRILFLENIWSDMCVMSA